MPLRHGGYYGRLENATNYWIGLTPFEAFNQWITVATLILGFTGASFIDTVEAPQEGADERVYFAYTAMMSLAIATSGMSLSFNAVQLYYFSRALDEKPE